MQPFAALFVGTKIRIWVLMLGDQLLLPTDLLPYPIPNFYLLISNEYADFFVVVIFLLPYSLVHLAVASFV